MPLRQPLPASTPLTTVQQHYPSTWHLLQSRLDGAGSQLQQLYFDTATEADYAATSDLEIRDCSVQQALQLWARNRRLGELMHALSSAELFEADALLQQNLLNVPPDQLLRAGQQLQLNSNNCFSHYTYDELNAAVLKHQKKIGSGGFANVYRGCINGVEVAVKDYKQSMQEQCRVAIRTSTHAISRLQEQLPDTNSTDAGCVFRPRIARILGFCDEEEKKRLLTVFEYYPNGNLRQLIDKFKRRGDSTAAANASIGCAFHLASVRLRMAAEIAASVAFLHSQGDLTEVYSGRDAQFYYVHQDVKTVNVLIDRDWHCYLGDLDYLELASEGTGKTEVEDRRVAKIRRIRTKGFSCAKDSQDNQPITCKFDVYSTAVSIVELITGQPGEAFDDLHSSSSSSSNSSGRGSSSSSISSSSISNSPLQSLSPQAGLCISQHVLEQLCTEVLAPALNPDYRLRCTASELCERLQQLQRLAAEEEQAANEKEEEVEVGTASGGRSWQLKREELMRVHQLVRNVCCDGEIKIFDTLCDVRIISPTSSEAATIKLQQLQQLRHHNLQLVLHTVLQQQQHGKILLLLEHHPSGSVRDFIANSPSPSPSSSSSASSESLALVDRLLWLRQLTSALQYLHNRRVAHLSVDCDCVLLTPDRQCRLGGLHRRCGETKGEGQGDDEAGHAFDISCCGVVMLELLRGFNPNRSCPASMGIAARNQLAAQLAHSSPSPRPGAVANVDPDTFDQLMQRVLLPCMRAAITAAVANHRLASVFDSPTQRL